MTDEVIDNVKQQGFPQSSMRNRNTSVQKPRTLSQIPKESFQSIDEFELPTEEDEQASKMNSKQSQQSIQEPPRIPLTEKQRIPVQKNPNSKPILFYKPKYIARNLSEIDVSKQFNTLDASSPSKKTLSHPQSPMFLHMDNMSVIKETEENENTFGLKVIGESTTPMKRTITGESFHSGSHNWGEFDLKSIQKKKQSQNASEIPIAQPIMNIFNADPLQKLSMNGIDFKSSQAFKDGPRFSAEGNILQYSLVGRPEWFQRLSETGGKDTPKSRGMYSNTHSNSNSNANNRFSMASKTSSFRIRTQFDSMSRVDKKKKSMRNTIISSNVSKEQLLKKLEGFENRIEENKKKDIEQNTNKHAVNEVLGESRQRNNLEFYKKTSSQWENMSQTISQIVKRPPDETLLKSSGSYFRQRLEVAAVIEQVKSTSEILGDKFWEATLRDKAINFTKNDEENQLKAQHEYEEIAGKNEGFAKKTKPNTPNISFYRELSNTKGTRVPIRFKKDLEIIKQPRLLSEQQHDQQHQQPFYPLLNPSEQLKTTNTYTNSSTLMKKSISDKLLNIIVPLSRPLSQGNFAQPFSRSQNYFFSTNSSQNQSQFTVSQFGNSQLEGNHSQDRISQLYNAFNVDAEELIIQGESKLKVEKEALVNDGNPGFYIYKQFTEEELEKREALRHLGALEKQPTEEKTPNNPSHHPHVMKQSSIHKPKITNKQINFSGSIKNEAQITENQQGIKKII